MKDSFWQKAGAMFRWKCPNCRKGNMFPHFAYHPTKFSKAYDECPVCKEDFVIEPGFYFGAMYFSYGINVGIFVVSLLVTLYTFDPESIQGYLLGIFPPLIILFPLTFRVSRALMLHLFGGIKRKPEEVVE